MATDKKQPGKTGDEVKYTTPMGRLSFPNLFEARGNPFNEKKHYSLDILFSKNDDLSGFKKACNTAIINAFGADKAKWPKDLKIPLLDQADMMANLEEKGKPTSHLENGGTYLKVKSEYRPVVVDKSLADIQDETEIYGGCYGKVSMNIKAYQIGKASHVTLYLTGFQKVKDGDTFGGGRPQASSLFEAVDGDDEDSVLL